MHPILFVIPLPFTDTKILIYSVFFSITFALVLAIYLGTRAAQKEGLSVEIALNMTFFGLIALILGARLYVFFENPSFYFSHPIRFLKLWEGSLATYGGAIGGVLGCMIYLLLKKQPMQSFFDVYAPYGFLGLGIIRTGDFLNGTAFGKRTDMPWGVSFPKESFPYNFHVNHGWMGRDATESLAIHPTQLYSAIACYIIFLILLYRPAIISKFPGNRFLAGATVYAVIRIIVDYFRDDLQKHLWGNLSSTQWVGIIVLCLLIPIWIYLARRQTGEAST